MRIAIFQHSVQYWVRRDRPEAGMKERDSSILSIILNKRIRDLGFESLRKFYLSRQEPIGISYELFRQVMRSGRIPRPESLLPILRAAQLPDSTIRMLLSRLYPHLNVDPSGLPAFTAETLDQDASPAAPSSPVISYPAPPEIAGSGSPAEMAERLCAALSRIPLGGNEDIWEMSSRLAEIAERKVRDQARGRIEQPLLFGKEPEAIYQFLVRRGKAVPFMSRGESCALSFEPGIDYRDRFRGAILGQAIGARMGAITQGLSGEEVRQLYGRLSDIPEGRPGHALSVEDTAFNGRVVRELAENAILDPERISENVASEVVRSDATRGERRFAANFIERRYPWFESGEPVAESAPAARCAPIALRHAADFRRMKLETGIFATITHPHPASISGAILMAVMIAKGVHARGGSIDPISFARSCGPVIAGIENERGGAGRGRALPSLSRKVGTELPALLLRRASIDEIAQAVGNGEAPSEGIPFSMACVLSNPDDFREAVLVAVNSGGDAIRTGAMAGALSGAMLGASAIPPEWLEPFPNRAESHEACAEALLAASGAPISEAGFPSP